jgi:hypothetical protein
MTRLIYPFLEHLLEQMGLCNDMPLRRPIEWPDGLDVVKLERQAARIPEDRIETFVDGEEDEVLALARELDVEALHAFLNEAFDGAYSRLFD